MRASSDGPVQPNTSPYGVTTALDIRIWSSASSLEDPISLRAGIEYARVVLSPKTPTRANPWSSNSVTAAESQKTLSQDLEAPLAFAGLKMRASV